jgi:hypothetical protein
MLLYWIFESAFNEFVKLKFGAPQLKCMREQDGMINDCMNRVYPDMDLLNIIYDLYQRKNINL